MAVLWIIVGVIIGILLATFIFAKLYIGIMVVDRSDPTEPPYLFTELKYPIQVFQKQPYVLLKLENRNYVSHE